MIKIKVAVTSKGKELDSEVDNVFGRCQYFIFAEVKDGKIGNFEAIENKFVNQMGGAGISAAQFVTEKDVKAAITRNVGPRALDVLKQFNVEVFNSSGQVKEVLNKLINGKLEKIN